MPRIDIATFINTILSYLEENNINMNEWEVSSVGTWFRKPETNSEQNTQSYFTLCLENTKTGEERTIYINMYYT